MKKKTIALAGNPNVGKSTLFNALTGLKQHTGNWAGKTVTNAVGVMKYGDTELEFVDLPGTYSLSALSPDERAAAEYIKSEKADIILIVADASCLQRNLLLVKEILNVTSNVILCVNLMDDATKKGIHVDTEKLSTLLRIPVFPTAARSGSGIDRLVRGICSFSPVQPDSECVMPIDPLKIYNSCVTLTSSKPHSFDRRLDRIVTSRATGFPIMILLLVFIFWLTMAGANYPSSALSSAFSLLEEKLRTVLEASFVPSYVTSFLMDGIYTSLTWVISVMLPPMAIFFPLFTLLEDFGYLPRVAFNLDNAFKKCGAHGKQALTTCMGFGCNACGVMGCRIIESPRERLIAVLTNSLVPCNGRFPALIALILIFFTAGKTTDTLLAGIILTFFIILGIAATLLLSLLLSKTLLKGVPSAFALELPPYRIPKFSDVIIRSVLDRTVFVLGRAVLIAAPAGAVIWVLANIAPGDISILDRLTDFMDPLGTVLGLDGVILTAFLLGFPANETVIPIMLMCYMSTGVLTDYASLSQLQNTLTDCGWNEITALCVIILYLFHFPCGTTCLTIKKETGSLKWTALAVLMPACLGMSLCFIINMLYHLSQAVF